jgi:hypothetical protein
MPMSSKTKTEDRAEEIHTLEMTLSLNLMMRPEMQDKNYIARLRTKIARLQNAELKVVASNQETSP